MKKLFILLFIFSFCKTGQIKDIEIEEVLNNNQKMIELLDSETEIKDKKYLIKNNIIDNSKIIKDLYINNQNKQKKIEKLESEIKELNEFIKKNQLSFYERIKNNLFYFVIGFISFLLINFILSILKKFYL